MIETLLHTTIKHFSGTWYKPFFSEVFKIPIQNGGLRLRIFHTFSLMLSSILDDHFEEKDSWYPARIYKLIKTLTESVFHQMGIGNDQFRSSTLVLFDRNGRLDTCKTAMRLHTRLINLENGQ
uniref:AlNc14C95G5829 protein n=1 Tax=Albugo laibachii Nc14 TaxID=890382 RepID=F0WGV3_9STRA|nr:AlNc14C95G5829 [Albugo laibachii Nc14]|eukprot:CCA20468.1 AlNc14C95G5829 [Albugo laibachii Nc14]